jgi:hypothetical protein
MDKRHAICAALGAMVLLGACAGGPRSGGGPRDGGVGPGAGPGPGAGGGPVPNTGCPPGVRPIGTLLVQRDTVFRNNRPARTGDTVCDGDAVTTNATGVGDVLPDNDMASDSVHLAENTDPRFSWTRSGCLSVDRFESGRIIATARRRCMLIRTPDALVYQPQGQTQFSVIRAIRTEVIPVQGVLVKLPQFNDEQVRNITRRELEVQRAPVQLQPQGGAVNVYVRHQMIERRPIQNPNELHQIDRSRMRTPAPR